LILPPCTDFKKAHDGDTGPNTGGMGAICPVPWVDAPLMVRITQDVVEPTYAALSKEGLLYRGVLYFGLMITAAGPKILEFNVRFGDPEAQVLMPLLGHDLGDLFAAMANGSLDSVPAAPAPQRAALGVVVASRGYPNATEKGALVPPFSLPGGQGSMMFHASTTRDPNGAVRTGGGRCFTAVGTGIDLVSAGHAAYRAASAVKFDGAWFRGDIGRRFMQGNTGEAHA
jgi:phosphoribosylamine--glycine ligase